MIAWLGMNSSSPSKEVLEKCYMCLNSWTILIDRKINVTLHYHVDITSFKYPPWKKKNMYMYFHIRFSDKASVISVKWVSSDFFFYYYYFYTYIIEAPRHKKSVSLNRTWRLIMFFCDLFVNRSVFCFFFLSVHKWTNLESNKSVSLYVFVFERKKRGFGEWI